MEKIEEIIDLLEEISPIIGLKINKQKSAILETCCRKYAKPNWKLIVGSDFKGYPIVSDYFYLGIKIDRTLSLESTFKPIKAASMGIIRNLQSFLLNASIDLRVNV